ncbi:MAG: 2-amino-4-hydroxy-6-hydroxymethyldihydropteridine diphosphokinase [Candidatus Omnitrophica bacterium]|nr:2-amino-4-hydroxy-6-hydroxymethyldihydropteridine diphosphokinase [Candidatus Omnitrophota bacterium]MBU1869389.1 2-amino-4-hydroxy-6-hydroxymethyldihydropteridine diphosphokinase [Candidatus Omnitrophota bacterium]
MAVCYLGIGSNLGDRRKNIKLAIKKINALKQTRVVKTSRIIETEPVGGPAGQNKYLNAALKIVTILSPIQLLKNLKKIEEELGRPRKHLRFGPRSIDLDILFYGDEIVNQKSLKIPHPRMREREFVIRPLLEII